MENKKHKNKILILSVVLIMVLIGSTCSGCSNFSGINFLDGSGKTYDDDTVYVAIEKIETLNPAISKDAEYYHISKLIYNGLFTLDNTLVPHNTLVNSYSYTDKGDGIELHLKNGIKWHDGKEFTANDVKFTIDSLKTLSYTNETLYGEYVSSIKSVVLDKTDPLKVTVNFNTKENANISYLIFPILPAHQFKNIAALKGSDESFSPIGTGAYKFESYDSLKALVLVANENYFDSVPNNSMVFKVLPEKKLGLNLINSYDISILSDEKGDRKTRLKDNLLMYNYTSNEMEIIGFNFDNTFLQDKYLRKAIATSINTQAILDEAYYGYGVLADSIVYPNYYGVENTGDAYSYNFETAKTYYKKVKLGDEDKITLRLLINSDINERVLASSSIEKSIEKLGIDVVIDACNTDLYNAKLQGGQYDLYLGGAKINEREDLTPMLHSSKKYSSNYARYTNDKIDKLIDNMNSNITTAEKRKTVENLKGILKDEIPYYTLFFKTSGIFYSDSFKGEFNPCFNNLYNGCFDWYCSYPEGLKQQ